MYSDPATTSCRLRRICLGAGHENHVELSGMKRFHMRPQTQETIAGRRATGTACSQIPQKNRKLEMPEVHGGGIGQKVFPVK